MGHRKGNLCQQEVFVVELQRKREEERRCVERSVVFVSFFRSSTFTMVKAKSLSLSLTYHERDLAMERYNVRLGSTESSFLFIYIVHH